MRTENECYTHPDFIRIKNSELRRTSVKSSNVPHAIYYRDGGCWSITVKYDDKIGKYKAAPIEFNENCLEHLDGEICEISSYDNYIADNYGYVMNPELEKMKTLYGLNLTMDDVNRIGKTYIHYFPTYLRNEDLNTGLILLEKCNPKLARYLTAGGQEVHCEIRNGAIFAEPKKYNSNNGKFNFSTELNGAVYLESDEETFLGHIGRGIVDNVLALVNANRTGSTKPMLSKEGVGIIARDYRKKLGLEHNTLPPAPNFIKETTEIINTNEDFLI